MANVRLLRQSVNDYEKQMADANKEVAGVNATYGSAYDKYVADVSTYNSMVTGDNIPRVKKTELYGLQDKDKIGVVTKDIVGPNGQVFSYALDQTGRYEGRGTPTTFGWHLVNTPAQPTAPTQGVVDTSKIRAPNLTQGDIKTLKNPPSTPSQGVMATNMGYTHVSNLADGDAPSKNSAFTNPDDPNNLRERGVLARVMGEQL